MSESHSKSHHPPSGSGSGGGMSRSMSSVVLSNSHRGHTKRGGAQRNDSSHANANTSTGTSYVLSESNDRSLLDLSGRPHPKQHTGGGGGGGFAFERTSERTLPPLWNRAASTEAVDHRSGSGSGSGKGAAPRGGFDDFSITPPTSNDKAKHNKSFNRNTNSSAAGNASARQQPQQQQQTSTLRHSASAIHSWGQHHGGSTGISPRNGWRANHQPDSSPTLPPPIISSSDSDDEPRSLQARANKTRTKSRTGADLVSSGAGNAGSASGVASSIPSPNSILSSSASPSTSSSSSSSSTLSPGAGGASPSSAPAIAASTGSGGASGAASALLASIGSGSESQSFAVRWLNWFNRSMAYACSHAGREKHFICEPKNSRILLFVFFIQYLHVVSMNAAYYMHTPREPLWDIGFQYLPYIDPAVPAYLAYTVLAITAFFLVSPFAGPTIASPSSPSNGSLSGAGATTKRRKPIFTVLMLARFCLVLIFSQTLRVFTFMVTTLPGPSERCRPDSKEYAPPKDYMEVLTRIDFNLLGVGCGDLVFSSAMIWVVLCALTVSRYAGGAEPEPPTADAAYAAARAAESGSLLANGRDDGGEELEGEAAADALPPVSLRVSLLRRFMWFLVFVFGLSQIAARTHYTLDILVAGYTVPLLWVACERYFPDRIPPEFEVELRVGAFPQHTTCSHWICSGCQTDKPLATPNLNSDSVQIHISSGTSSPPISPMLSPEPL